MAERIKQIPQKLLEFWNRYTSKQKTIIISVVAVLFLMIVILSYVLSRPTYVQLTECEDNKSASDVIAVLNENSIANKYDTSTNIISVRKKDYQSAVLLMAKEGLDSTDTSKELNWDWSLDTGISTTETDKQVRNNLALQNELRRNLIALEMVDDARVMINKPADTYNILQDQKPSAVTAYLTLNREMTQDESEALATVLANSVGNDDTANVRIIDSVGNLLFDGSEQDSLEGTIKTAEEYKTRAATRISENLEKVLLKTGWDEAAIATDGLEFNMDEVEQRLEEYSIADGLEQPYHKNEYEYANESSGGTAGTPGTDSNDSDTDYMLSNPGGTESETTLNKYENALNTFQQSTIKERGTLNKESSSLSVVLTRYITYDEEILENNGTLGDMTFDEFIAANDASTTVQIPEDDILYTLVANATGINAASIVITGMEVPYFQYKLSGSDNPVINFLKNPANVLMLVLALLIIGLLIFTVLKGTAPVEVTEVEPELSVETILAGTKENQSLQDVEFSEKSETRKMIEKFVDENPEAVAQLLRNWLNDDWD